MISSRPSPLTVRMNRRHGLSHGLSTACSWTPKLGIDSPEYAAGPGDARRPRPDQARRSTARVVARIIVRSVDKIGGSSVKIWIKSTDLGADVTIGDDGTVYISLFRPRYSQLRSPRARRCPGRRHLNHVVRRPQLSLTEGLLHCPVRRLVGGATRTRVGSRSSRLTRPQ